METARRILLWAVGILMAIAFINIAMSFYGKSTQLSKAADRSLNELTATLTNSRFTEFDNTTVSGTQVINAIRLYASDTLYVQVATKKTTTVYRSNDYSVNNVNDDKYIEPTGNFRAYVDKNENNSVIGLRFVQQ